jgi:hypothetical protein
MDNTKIIHLSNGYDHDVDVLVQYLIGVNDENIDPISSALGLREKIWKTEDEKKFILLHPGLDREIKQNYDRMVSDILRRREIELEYIYEEKNILTEIAKTGWICLNNTNHTIERLCSEIDKSKNKVTWLTFKASRESKSLQEIFSLSSDRIGPALLSYYLDFCDNL